MTTPAEAHLRVLALARSPEERLRMAARMFAGARILVQAGFGRQGRDGGDDDAEMRRHIFRRFYGREFSSGQGERILAYLTTRG